VVPRLLSSLEFFQGRLLYFFGGVSHGKEKYYLTTAIAYASAIPHIGNVYEAILADAIADLKD
jgi:hypothetical protein